MSASTEELLAKVRLQSKIPVRQINDTNLLSLADGVISTKIVPEVIATNGSFFKFSPPPVLVTPTSYNYRFPAGAIGGGLLDVIRKQDIASIYYWNLGQITEGDKYKVLSKYGSDYFFILNAGGLSVFPPPWGNFYLEVHYLLRPGKLIPTSQSTQIIAPPDLVNNTITVSNPYLFTPGKTVDVMKSDGLNERVNVGVLITGITGSVLNLSDASNMNQGDTVAAAGYAPFLQVPDEYTDYTVDRIVIKLAQLIGDNDLFQMAKASAVESKPNVMNVINPRVKEEVLGVMPDW